MKYFLPVLCTLLLAVATFCCTAQISTSLSVNEFESKLATSDSNQLLDVRTPAEYSTGHLKNALQADWTDKTEFSRRIGFIDKNKPVYIYCLSGGRSGAAAKEMRSLGYSNVYELNGGIISWKAANKGLEGKSAEPPMTIDQFNKSINASSTVLVDFGATWCPPCKKMEPVLKSLTQKYPGKFSIFKVDGGKDEAVMKQYAVTALPVFILFKNGKQIWRKDGVVAEDELAAALLLR